LNSFTNKVDIAPSVLGPGHAAPGGSFLGLLFASTI
jgi:hypothetical protein